MTVLREGLWGELLSIDRGLSILVADFRIDGDKHLIAS